MTNCDVGPHEAQKIAQMACNELPRIIYPVNTSADRDAVFSIDGVDGLAAGIVIILVFAISYIGYIHGYYLVC